MKQHLKQAYSRPPARSTSGALEILDTGAVMEKLIDETCPNCGAKASCIDVRPSDYDDGLDDDDLVLYYTCFDCDWRGHVSADTDEILWDEIFRG